MRVTLENQCSIMPDSIVALPDDGYSVCQQVLQHGDYGKYSRFVWVWAQLCKTNDAVSKRHCIFKYTTVKPVLVVTSVKQAACI